MHLSQKQGFVSSNLTVGIARETWSEVVVLRAIELA